MTRRSGAHFKSGGLAEPESDAGVEANARLTGSTAAVLLAAEGVTVLRVLPSERPRLHRHAACTALGADDGVDGLAIREVLPRFTALPAQGSTSAVAPPARARGGLVDGDPFRQRDRAPGGPAFEPPDPVVPTQGQFHPVVRSHDDPRPRPRRGDGSPGSPRLASPHAP
jgi:hypothetical protein